MATSSHLRLSCLDSLPFPVILAALAAASLVTASAGLGAYYAFTVGSHAGSLASVLFVLFAVGLELAKPLAVSSAFNAFRSRSVGSCVALALLALVAVAYSLTAELSVMATSRGDAIAQREAAIKTAAEAEAANRRAAERHERAKAELASLPATRFVGELQAEIAGLLLTPAVNGCVAIDGPATARVCPKVAELRAESARAQRRADLERTLAQSVSETVGANATSPTVSKPDPAASALAAYLAALGFAVAPAVLSEWLALVPVLALEVGSACSVLLIQAASRASSTQALDNRKQDHYSQAEPEPVVHVVQAGAHERHEAQPSDREEVKNRIVRQLQMSGGSRVASERGLARLIGTSRPTARRALQNLVVAGVIAAEAGRNGTMLRLVA